MKIIISTILLALFISSNAYSKLTEDQKIKDMCKDLKILVG